MKISATIWKYAFLTAVFCLCLWACAEAPLEHYDILIQDTLIVDGTGKPAFKGNVAIAGEKIVALGRVKGTADTVIDGSGLITSPGFIDTHTHADTNILNYPRGDNFIMQGVTTVVGGNCARSPAPQKELTFKQWFAQVEEAGITPNLAVLVSHVTVRNLVLGADFKREATPAEVEEMKAYVKEAMASGAIGMSTTLDPPFAGEFASIEEEVIPLAKVVGEYGGGYWPHHRHHRSHWASSNPQEVGYGIFHGPAEDAFVGTYRGLVESIEISRRAGIPLHVGHLVNVYRIPQPHPDFLDEAVAKATLWVVDQAIEEGIDITFDVTYALYGVATKKRLLNEFWRSPNIALSWLNEFEREEAIAQLKTAEVRARIGEVHERGRLKLGMIHTKADPYWMDRFKILVCANTGYEGQTISEIARLKNADPLDVLFMILEEDPETLWVQHLDERYFEAAVPVLLKHPHASPNTDWASAPPLTKPEEEYDADDISLTATPIAYGMFADYIGTMVRDREQMSLEEAVNRATYVPARKALGLENRGILKQDAYADIVVFNLETIRMTGTWMEPVQAPDGIEYVLVNGQIVYQDKTHTGGKPGKILKHGQK